VLRLDASACVAYDCFFCFFLVGAVMVCGFLVFGVCLIPLSPLSPLACISSDVYPLVAGAPVCFALLFGVW
jgi:hypothetical protein